MDDTLAQLNVKQRTVEKQQKVAQDPVEETITIEKIPKLNLDKVQATGDANNEVIPFVILLIFISKIFFFNW